MIVHVSAFVALYACVGAASVDPGLINNLEDVVRNISTVLENFKAPNEVYQIEKPTTTDLGVDDSVRSSVKTLLSLIREEIENESRADYEVDDQIDMKDAMNKIRLLGLSFLDMGHSLLSDNSLRPIIPNKSVTGRNWMRKYNYPESEQNGGR